MRAWLTALLLAMAALPTRAEEVVLGLSQDTVSISTRFEGSDILIFGAIKREAAILTDPPLQVIITLAGPNQELTVRRKERRFGIWVNADTVDVDAAPSFYAIATSAPWREVLSATEDLRHKISIERAIRSVGAPSEVTDSENFTEAVIRIRENSGVYDLRESTVTLRESTLFDTRISLPANLIEGAYPTRIFLTRDGRVVATYATEIDVRKVGLERWLYELAHQQPLVYGLMSIALAIAAGWGASAAFRFVRSG
ncbi:TIGR02186 family protein [Thetidibacter halocola]|uniref:TIGR02186 family protein n=1 Tax=Thetidibacter halocola TaxID=2827239 RepID=A0A8J7WGU7_9RHOB|nr:TIGR02186 family protein [Thetidibacter halocola]MBS0124858.1 TIGR02186 family protein [Thetidibacter halocola]